MENAKINKATSKLTCSIGVIVFNEQDNICRLLKALMEQKLERVTISEIIVVSSACTDSTDELVCDFALDHPRISLICEMERKGKASAINIFLKEAKSDILIIESGDTIPAPDTIEKLITPFFDAKIGATGGRPMPVNNPKSFMGNTVHLLWRLHHRMALINPKLGEMIAFRRLFNSIPSDSAVDEASIEAIIKANRLRLKYIPDALIYNKGPENISDFIKQRRRIQNGHLWLKQKQHYTVTSQDSGVLSSILISEVLSHPLQLPMLIWVMGLEVFCRLLGTYDYYVKKKNPFTWDIATSTKNLNVSDTTAAVSEKAV
jgi:glycosyltransferase involved in cell wall biosynthesis